MKTLLRRDAVGKHAAQQLQGVAFHAEECQLERKVGEIRLTLGSSTARVGGGGKRLSDQR